MGVDRNVRVFPADSGFHRSGASEPHPNLGCAIPYVYKCVVCFKSKNLLLGVTDITGFTFSSEFLHLEVKTPLSGEPDGILCRFGVDFGFSCSYGLT